MMRGTSPEAKEKGLTILKGVLVGGLIIGFILGIMTYYVRFNQATVVDTGVTPNTNVNVYWSGGKDAATVGITSTTSLQTALSKLTAAGQLPVPEATVIGWNMFIVGATLVTLMVGGSVGVFGGWEYMRKARRKISSLAFSFAIGLTVPFTAIAFTVSPFAVIPMATVWAAAWIADVRSTKRVHSASPADFWEMEQCVPLRASRRLGINRALVAQMFVAEIPLLLFYVFAVGPVLLAVFGLSSLPACLASAFLLSSLAHTYASKQNSFIRKGQS